MGCSNCSSGQGGLPAGCKNNGACGVTGCGEKLDVHDWLSNIYYEDDSLRNQLVEVKFKNTRKGFFNNKNGIQLEIGDLVMVESETGVDAGHVSMRGELVKLQMKKKGAKEDQELPNIIRRAHEKDINTYKEAKERELPAMFKTRKIAKGHKLKMKISDVEFQGDNRKATFYYTADGRVDFRELIKDLAREFKVKIEMRQIGLRQEAGRVGGIGDCGRELCCSTWLTDFDTVPTIAAKHQNLFLNPLKLSGQCGRLKCCLNYELDTYLEALEDFPDENTVLETAEGNARLFKMDILKRMMWFSITNKETGAHKVYPMHVENVHKVIGMNKTSKKPESLNDFSAAQDVPSTETQFKDVVGEESLTRFDKKKKKGGGKRRRKGGKQTRGRKPENSNKGAGQRKGNKGKRKPSGKKPNSNRGNKKE